MSISKLLALEDTNSAATTASCAGVLTAHLESPVVTQTTVVAHALKALQILTGAGLQGVGDQLGVLAGGEVTLTVKHPHWDLELEWVLDDGHQLLDLLWGELTSAAENISLLPRRVAWKILPLVHVYISLLAHQVGEAAADTLDGGQGELDLLASLNVSVKDTQNVLELRGSKQRLCKI